MTKDDAINMLKIIDTADAGKALSFVGGLDVADERFKIVSGRPTAAVAYWLAEMARGSSSSREPSDYVAAFLGKLKDEHHVDRVDPSVMRRLLTYFGERMRTAAQPSVASEVAFDVYQEAQMLPGTETKVCMETDLNLSINGPIAAQGRTVLLSAVDLATGALLAIKMLPTHERSLSQAAASEKQAVTLLRLDEHEMDEVSGGLPLVPAKLIKVQVGDPASAKAVGVGKERLHEALKMPLLASSLARLPQLSEHLICTAGRRLQQAVLLIHAAGLVHCDIKSDNVMVSASGRFYLTDFGSSVKTGMNIVSCTQGWYPGLMLFQPADPKHDWGMLVVLLAAELRKSAMHELLDDAPVPKVDKKAVLERCAKALNAELKALLQELIQLAGWAADA